MATSHRPSIIPENKVKKLCREAEYGKLDIRPLSKERQLELKQLEAQEELNSKPLSPKAFQWGGL